MLPQLLTADTLDLKGNELPIIRIGQADTAESTLLYVPALAAVVTGDLAYNRCRAPRRPAVPGHWSRRRP